MNLKSRIPLLLISLFMSAYLALSAAASDESEWHILFDGSSLDGWRSNDEAVDVFRILEGEVLQVQGGRAHLFWMGTKDIPAVFENFELRAKVKTTWNSNSGIFFHTKFQKSGWPRQGLEAQVNSTNKDPRKTGSVYALKDILNDAPSTDGEWFDYSIHVEGKRVTIMVDEIIVNEYTEPDSFVLPNPNFQTKLGQGTIAIQGHDPKSTIYFKDIRVRLLD